MLSIDNVQQCYEMSIFDLMLSCRTMPAFGGTQRLSLQCCWCTEGTEIHKKCIGLLFVIWCSSSFEIFCFQSLPLFVPGYCPPLPSVVSTYRSFSCISIFHHYPHMVSIFFHVGCIWFLCLASLHQPRCKHYWGNFKSLHPVRINH